VNRAGRSDRYTDGYRSMKILFGVFDWGIGHAIRDIPLIDELLKDNEVHIISTGRALKIVRDHFKDRCLYYDVPSVHPPYTKTRFFKVKFTLLGLTMLRSLSDARKSSQEIVGRGFDKVISDCRYDVYDTPQNSYLINHQLRFKTPFGAERVFEKWLASRMKRYRYILVPDFEQKSLSVRLSHDLRYLQADKIKYIGILSHISKLDVPEDIEYFVSLSGPEIQRKLLEDKIISQLDQLEGKIVIAGGNPESDSNRVYEKFECYGFLGAKQQENFMNRAKFVVARAGYTTVMELVELNKKRVLLLPTPGQPEQEYLADYYEKKKYFHHVSQYRLKLRDDIEKSKQFEGFDPPWKTQESVKRFMQVINS